MRSRRGRIEIYLDLLAAIEAEPDLITSLITRVGLGYGLAKELLDKLVNFGFIRKDGVTYTITQEGSVTLSKGLSLMKSLKIEQTEVLLRKDIWVKG